MRILITGNLGYVGSSVARYLRAAIPDAELIGCDAAYFAHCLTDVDECPDIAINTQHFSDIRDIPAALLSGLDAVVHLAAVSNDPMGRRFETVTEEINTKASLRLAELASAARVRAFVFASSCSVYGFAEGGPRRESDPVNPLTAYARSKVAVELGLRAMNFTSMTATCLRFATACGMSPRLRLDLVLNDFVACAVTSGEITILSDGTPWRPLIDVEDMSRAIAWAIGRPPTQGGHCLAVNVGHDEWNFQVQDLAQAVVAAVPGTKVMMKKDAPPDNRSYRVDFSLFKHLALGHVPQLNVGQSVVRLRDGLTAMGFADKNFRNSPYIRLKMLERHIARRRLNDELRWQNPLRAAP
jgi:nucleoside-diphosphate-sugar epimerase